MCGFNAWVEAEHVSDLQNKPGFRNLSRELLNFRDASTNWFFAKDVLSRSQSLDRSRYVKCIRDGNDDRIDAFVSRACRHI